MKAEEKLVNIFKKALGIVKFLELCAKIGVKKVWDEKKIKGENDGRNFSSICMAGTCGTTIVCEGEHQMLTDGAHLAGIVAPTEMVPRGIQ